MTTAVYKLDDSVSPVMADMPDRNVSLLMPVTGIDPFSLYLILERFIGV